MQMPHGSRRQQRPYVWQSAPQPSRDRRGRSSEAEHPAPSSERVDFAFMQISRTLQTAQRFFLVYFFGSALQFLLLARFFDALLLAWSKLNFGCC